MFVPTFKLNDRVLKTGRKNDLTGTVVAVVPGADAYQVVWDLVGVADPPWYTAQTLKPAAPTAEENAVQDALEAAQLAKTVIAHWEMIPYVRATVGDRVNVLITTTEGNATEYQIRRGTVTASRTYEAGLTVLVDHHGFADFISSHVKRISF